MSLTPESVPQVTYVTFGGVVNIRSKEDHPVYDGDTLTVLRDMGHDIFFKTEFRLLGIDTPEMKKEEKPYAELSRQHLIDLLYTTTLWWAITAPNGQTMKIPALVMRSVEPDKYGGRWLGEIWLPGGKHQLQLEMIKDGFARPYDGTKKTPYPVDTIPGQPK